MNIAITGATGFVGKKLLIALLNQGNSIRILTRNRNIQREIPDEIQVFYGDLTNKADDLSDFVRGIDVLYHCAAEIKKESVMFKVNVEGTQRLIEAANNNIKHWVQLSSTGVYGSPLKGVITENTPPVPHNIYETSKLFSDKLLVDNNDIEKTFSYTILRPSNIYGASMSNQSIFQLIKSVDVGLFFFIGKKGASANYIHIDNVVDALIECGHNRNACSKIFNISDRVTMENFIYLIAKHLRKSEPRIRVPRFIIKLIVIFFSIIPKMPLTLSRVYALSNMCIYDSSYIVKELSFNFKVSMDKGVSELVDEYLIKKNK